MSFKKFNDSQKDNTCAVSRGEKKNGCKGRAGIKTQNSKQELRCYRQDRDLSAEVKSRS